MTAKARARRRITGLETEYGSLASPGAGGGRAIYRIRDWIFENQRYGLVDLHERDWEEPPGNGGFLFNGGRLYIDMGHIEYCTPECATAADVVRYDRAGDAILLEAVRALGLGDQVQFIRNNVDHHSGATFGCHENFSLLRHAPLTEGNVLSLLTFLTLRLLMTGSGRVGGEEDAAGAADAIPFQISQRADFIQNDFYEWVQRSRAIINTRDEPLADPRLYRRLHLIHGDTNVLPSALYLKVGATRLVLDLLEEDALPPVILEEAVLTLRALSRRVAPPWRVRLRDGQEGDAVEVLSRFRLRAQERFSGRDAETDAVLELWGRVEAALASESRAGLVGLVDWATKLDLFERFRESEGLAWNDPWLEAQDLEYHQIDPARSLGLALADLNGPWAEGLERPEPKSQPPADTRAAARCALMRHLAKRPPGTYEIDWHCVQQEGREPMILPDPFDAKARKIG